MSDFTALGDTVNAMARLASVARAGEVLVSERALANAGIQAGHLEQRSLVLRGREAALDVRVADAAAIGAFGMLPPA